MLNNQMVSTFSLLTLDCQGFVGNTGPNKFMTCRLLAVFSPKIHQSARCSCEAFPITTTYPDISQISPRYLPDISQISPLYLPTISATPIPSLPHRGMASAGSCWSISPPRAARGHRGSGPSPNLRPMGGIHQDMAGLWHCCTKLYRGERRIQQLREFSL